MIFGRAYRILSPRPCYAGAGRRVLALPKGDIFVIFDVKCDVLHTMYLTRNVN